MSADLASSRRRNRPKQDIVDFATAAKRRKRKQKSRCTPAKRKHPKAKRSAVHADAAAKKEHRRKKRPVCKPKKKHGRREHCKRRRRATKPRAPGAAAPGGPPAPAAPAPAAPSAPTPAPADPGAPALPDGPADNPRALQATSGEYFLKLSKHTVLAGDVRVGFNNKSAEDPHDLKLARGSDVDGFDELPAGQIQAKTFHLAAGSWTLFCALPEHAQRGMKATLTVAAN